MFKSLMKLLFWIGLTFVLAPAFPAMTASYALRITGLVEKTDLVTDFIIMWIVAILMTIVLFLTLINDDKKK
ncbi:hypothetical protein LMB49_10695 [Limosilactobacillus reuteri]|uniref:hypothetical protein n=1 Tax=Limosilactobacillus reuteri TaxID=1598 RepID=UPI001E401D45|nr:hypothetical protein [Limosilactobacillus reuteri]MCC4370571.1 hypothetical protein [Limosilactobacillus reuteri]MCC4371860.1 hypothetical protein [Limosilactobacillus reuteri]MCC4509332.1 hypothetical protein [Limosilactobacillus reuteri]MCC4509375.1 hypothetical protein [Limosilactobacillus reuteri]